MLLGMQEGWQGHYSMVLKLVERGAILPEEA